MSKKSKRQHDKEQLDKFQAAELEHQRIEERGGHVPGLVMPNLGGPLTPGGGRLQMRSKYTTDQAVYAPARDIANLFPHLCEAALTAFESPDQWPGWLGEVLRSRGVTRDDIGKAAECLAAGLALFISDPIRVPNAYTALQIAGFYNTRPEAQWAIFARLGEVTTGSYFVGIRDITPLGSEPRNKATLLEIARLARSIGDQLRNEAERQNDGPIKVT